MKTTTPATIALIQNELASIPEKYQKNFNSAHEGYAVILEEVRELENEVFFGEKKCYLKYANDLDKSWAKHQSLKDHKKLMREECVQIAAMCIRFIQELTDQE